MLKPFYQLLKSFFILVFPITLVLFSISTNLTNGTLHKETIRSSNFYQDLSGELNKSEEGFDPTRGVVNLLVITVASDLANPGWLQNLMERNIDLTTGWLNGTYENWSLYFPIGDLDRELREGIDRQIVNLVQKNPTIPVCSQDREKEIKEKGYVLTESFCLPQSVKDGKQTLTEFFGVNSQDSTKGILDFLIRDNNLSLDTEVFNINSSANITNLQTRSIDELKIFRDGFLIFRNFITTALIFFVGIFLLIVATSNSADKRIFSEIRQISWLTSNSILVLSGLIILLMGGTAYLTSSINTLILPGFSTTRITNLLSWQILLFSFNLVSWAVWTGLALLIIHIILKIQHQIELSRKVKEQNPHLVQQPSFANTPATDATLDAQFKILIHQQSQDGETTAQETTQTQPASTTAVSVDQFQAQMQPATTVPVPPVQTEQPTSVSTIDYPEDTGHSPEANNNSQNPTPTPPKTWF